MELEESPDITFDNIGGLEKEIEEVREAVEYPLTRPEIFERVGVEPPKGILLYGPPGTGKTLIAKAVAHEAKATFIRMSGSELVHKYIGEGAQLVRELFMLARERSPSIVFIDEIDAVGSTRTNDGTSGSAEVQRTLMQLLAEMDGFDNRGDVRIMAATNPVDMLDPAQLRPEDSTVSRIPLPDREARLEILKIHSRRMIMHDVDLENIVEMSKIRPERTSGNLPRSRDDCSPREASGVSQDDFLAAVRKVRAEVSTDNRMYI